MKVLKSSQVVPSSDLGVVFADDGEVAPPEVAQLTYSGSSCRCLFTNEFHDLWLGPKLGGLRVAGEAGGLQRSGGCVGCAQVAQLLAVFVHE